MQISFDPENLGSSERELLNMILAHVNPDNPAIGTVIHVQTAASAPSLTAVDAQAAFGGGAPLAPPAPSSVGAGQFPTALATLTPGAPLSQTPALPPSGPAFAPVAGSVPGNVPALNPVPAGTTELDAQGFPWDARIHATTKEKNKNGTWRAFRGLDPSIKGNIEAELRALGFGSATPPASQEPPAPNNAALMAQLMGGAPAAIAKPAPVTFEELANEVVALQTANRLMLPELFEMCNKVGVQAFHHLQQRHDLVPHVWALIVQKVGAV